MYASTGICYANILDGKTNDLTLTVLIKLRQLSENQQLLFDFIISVPSTNIDEYSEKLVQLIGWGAKVRNGAASDKLKRIAVSVFPMRYIKMQLS